MPPRGSRPARARLDEAALALVARHGGQILATARRYAATAEDAEDAYQRGLEILLTKAPTASEEELIPWLKTVVKHEAFALRRARERHSPVTDDGHLGDRPTPHAVTHDQAARLEQLSQGAEALRDLKPQEIRALVLKAEGYSYREIGELTGWSYTKVNRLITEGRRAFLRRVAAIQAGGECERYEPLLSALADGEAAAGDLALLRPHMRTCLACRARLREFRAAPARVAALVPPAALGVAAGDGGGLRGAFESALGSAQQKLDGLVGVAQQKSAALGDRAHAAVELATGQKLAAIAASAAALAGGGTAIDEFANHQGPPTAQAETLETKPVKEESAVETSPTQPEPTPVATTPDTAAAPAPTPEPRPAPPPAPPDPANEFAPGGAAPAAPAATPQAPAPAAAPAPGGFAPTGGGGGSGEFTP